MLWPFNRPALNPARTARARHDFDVTRGFEAYEAHCRAVAGRPRRHDGGLETQGIELVEAGTEPGLGPVLDALDDRIAGHFGSDYLVFAHTRKVTLPSRAENRSFRWHCDRGPRRFLKILLYLNDGHGGNTEFLDRDTTAEFQRIGYVFGPNKRRLTDLSGPARRHGIPYEPKRFPIQAGQAFLFEPSQVLHRGIVPKAGARHVLSIVLLASPVPWRAAIERMAPLSEGMFPNHADAILSAVQ